MSNKWIRAQDGRIVNLSNIVEITAGHTIVYANHNTSSSEDQGCTYLMHGDKGTCKELENELWEWIIRDGPHTFCVESWLNSREEG